mmetsp:Transcript_69223/g.218739  ORF Transcript_69223/g.218739 Transcript_69223/m.218739 type:complete len:232 (+) Transcript_69223:711-1406(+)
MRCSSSLARPTAEAPLTSLLPSSDGAEGNDDPPPPSCFQAASASLKRPRARRERGDSTNPPGRNSTAASAAMNGRPVATPARQPQAPSAATKRTAAKGQPAWYVTRSRGYLAGVTSDSSVGNTTRLAPNPRPPTKRPAATTLSEGAMRSMNSEASPSSVPPRATDRRPKRSPKVPAHAAAAICPAVPAEAARANLPGGWGPHSASKLGKATPMGSFRAPRPKRAIAAQKYA